MSTRSMRICTFHRQFVAVLAMTALLTIQDSYGQVLHGEPVYYQRGWAISDGLPQSSVNAILQTSDGYLWVATFGGLARFDGVRFREFDLANTPGLESSRILSLAEDNQGALWIGTEEGSISRLTGDEIVSFGLRDGIAGALIWDIEISSDGRVWAATSKGLACYDAGRFTILTADDGLPASNIHSLKVDRAGDRLWVGTAAGLASVNLGSNEIAIESLGSAPPTAVWSILESQSGDMLIGTAGGLIRRTGDTYELLYENHEDLAGRIWTIAETRDGAIWVSSETQGLSRWPDGDMGPDAVSSLEILDNRTDRDRPLRDVRAIVQDLEGNIWIGLRGRGLRRLNVTPVQLFLQDDGYVGDVLPVLGHPDGGVLIGARESGIFHIQDGKATRLETDPDHVINSSQVFSLMWDRSGALWAGAMDRVSVLLDGNWVHLTMDSHELFSGAQRAIFEDHDGTIWIGSAGGVVAIRDSGIMTYTTEDGLAHNDVRFIMQSRSGDIYFGTGDGVSRFRDGRFESFTQDHGLSPGFVRAIYEDDDGAIWIGTYGGGLTRYYQGEFLRIMTSDGLLDSVVSCIMEDDQGRIWMNGNKGIFYTTRKSLNELAEGNTRHIHCRSFSTDQGVGEGNGGGQPAGTRTADGTFWFPGVEGLVAIHPDDVEPNLHPPPVVIEGITVDGNPISLSENVVLPPAPKNVQINYTGLGFTSPEAIWFEYHLEKHNAEWVMARDRRAAYYTSLGPGHYVFHVKAANEDGVWSESDASFSFDVAPLFYQTKLFRLLSLIAAGFAVWGLVQWRLVSTRRRMRSMESEIKRRRQAEEALRLSEARYRLLVEQAPEAIIVHDMETGHLVDANENAARLFGMSRDELRAVRLADLCPNLDSGACNSAENISVHFERAADGETPVFQCEYVSRSGKVTPCEVRLVLLPTTGRRLIRGSITDITERRAAEERQRLMMNELDHRVRNNLTSVLSLFDLSASTAKSLGEFRETFTGRLTAMARTHDALARKQWEAVDLSQLARIAIEPYVGVGLGRLRMDGESVRLPAAMVRPLTMALHELAVNAAKHGALSTSEGSVHLTWSTGPLSNLEIHWTESGGPPVTPPNGEDGGLGMSLVRGFVQHELGGTLDLQFSPQGLECAIEIPIQE